MKRHLRRLVLVLVLAAAVASPAHAEGNTAGGLDATGSGTLDTTTGAFALEMAVSGATDAGPVAAQSCAVTGQDSFEPDPLAVNTGSGTVHGCTRGVGNVLGEFTYQRVGSELIGEGDFWVDGPLSGANRAAAVRLRGRITCRVVFAGIFIVECKIVLTF